MEKKWKRVGTRLCALSMTAMLALAPAMAQAMTKIEVVDKGENVYGIKTTLEEGLNEKPVTIKVLDKNKEEDDQILFIAEGTSSEEGKVSVTVDLNGKVKPNQTINVSVSCPDETTPDEATIEYTIPAASNISLNVPSVNDAAASATVSGTAQPGMQVVVSVYQEGSGKITQSVTADKSGAFSATFTSLAYGAYSVNAAYSDSSIGGAGANTTFTLTKPAATLSVSAVGGENSITVNATGEPGATVTAAVAGQTQNGAFDASGACTFVFSSVAAGTYTVQVNDSTGQNKSADVTVTDKPAEIVQRDIAVTSVKPGAENVVIEGTASANAAVRVSGFGKEASVTADASGKFTCTFTGVTPGTYNALAAQYVDTDTYTGKPTSVSGSWTVTVSAQNIVITTATGGTGTISVSGTAKAGEKLLLKAVNTSTKAEIPQSVTADAKGSFSHQFTGLAAGVYTVSVSYNNASVGSGASVENVSVTAAAKPEEKAGIELDKLYETTLTVVGKTTPNCNVTIKVNYSGKEVSISRVSDSSGIFRIPLPRTMQKHTEITAVVTYSDGTTASATGHVYPGSASEEYRTVYKVGSRGTEVYRLEERLQALNYPISPDRVYDDETARIVRIFQRNNGLDVDGMAGPRTLTKLYSVTAVKYSGTDAPTDYIYLARGSRGTLVSQVQTRLKELGYYTIRVDGIFGVGTQTAVRMFQRNNGLSVTGVVNIECYKALMDTNAIGAGGSVSTPADYVELRRGNRGSAVVRLQARLQALGYYTISVDGIYGSGTQTAVRRFQSRNGISANGVATVYTQQVLFSSGAIASSSGTGTTTGYVYLHYGSNGDAVRRLQTALKNAGYYKGAIDGQYYDQTYAAVKAFQRAAGLAVDGIAGRKTQNALYGTSY